MERLKRHTVKVMIFLFLPLGVMLSGKFEICFILLIFQVTGCNIEFLRKFTKDWFATDLQRNCCQQNCLYKTF